MLARSRWGDLIAVLIVTVIAGGWRAGDATTVRAQESIRRGGTLVVALNSEPVGNFDPMVGSDGGSGAITTNVVEGLYKYDENLQPVPWLAERIEQPDDVTYVFQLRRGVRFHDGTEMDAEAVRFSIDRVRTNPASPGFADGESIVESTVVDRYTYRLVLAEPFAPLPSRLTGRLGAIVSPTAVRLQGDADFNRDPVGTGPFRSIRNQPGRVIRVERFDQYWRVGADGGPLPYLDAVEWRVIDDAFDRVDALQRGTVQIADAPIAIDDELRRDPRLVVAYAPDAGFGYTGLLLTLDRPPFDNRALRQALLYAIDRDELNDFWYGGGRVAAHGPIPPAFAWAVDPASRPYAYDPVKAREKLREGGRPAGFDFELWATESESELMDLVAEQLADVGIDMRIRTAPFGTVIERAQRRESNAYAIGFSTGLDPDGAFSRFLPGTFFNYFPYDNPRVTDLVLAARRTSDIDRRGALYREAVPLIMEDSPYIFFFTNPMRFVGSRRVQGWSLDVRATTGYSEYWLTSPSD